MGTSQKEPVFDLRLVSTDFRRSIRNQSGVEDVNISDYVQGYNELNKLFPRLGRLFRFIADDISEKTNILSEHQKSTVHDRYETVSRMMRYEREVELFKKSPTNGSRTLLRLHRALLFLIKFIDGMRQSGDADKMSVVARKAYDATLAQFHPWPVKKMVNLAVFTLPKRKTLITNLAGPILEADVDAVMQETVSSAQAAYDVVQRLYEQNQLLDLP